MRVAIRLLSPIHAAKSPLVSIKNATFYRRQPTEGATNGGNEPLFPNLSFEFPSSRDGEIQSWAVVGPSNSGKSTFLEILQGRHTCIPPTSRSFPHLSSEEVLSKDRRLAYPARAIQLVSFDTKERGLSGIGTYMSARYESRREKDDFSLLDFLKGNTQLNPAESGEETIDAKLLAKIASDLRLHELMDMPVTNLSNGQTRRARIAKALLAKPELLLLDEPFMGLDPPTLLSLSPMLQELAANSSPRIILSLRPQDPIPEWITHVAYLGEQLQITDRGPRAETVTRIMENTEAKLKSINESTKSDDDLEHLPIFLAEFGSILTPKGVVKQFEREQVRGERLWGHPSSSSVGEPVVEMDGVQVKYGDKVVLGHTNEMETIAWNWDNKTWTTEKDIMKNEGLHWTVRRGERWVVCGPNGSGKTTLLSLILSDHPQAYSLPLRIFGRSRLPTPGTPGISIFDIQRRIGHSSPEVHAFFPKHISVRAALESAFADTPLSRPNLSHEDDIRITACLCWFQKELNPAAGMFSSHEQDMLRRKEFVIMKDAVGTTEAVVYKRARLDASISLNVAKEEDAEWADTTPFSELTFSAQRVLLFLRAIVHRPDIIVLDEAFGGMDDVVRDKCQAFLEFGDLRRLSPFRNNQKGGLEVRTDRVDILQRAKYERLRNPCQFPGISDDQALIVVSHVQKEVPRCVGKWLFLTEPQSGMPLRRGDVNVHSVRETAIFWDKMWGMGKGREKIKVTAKRKKGRGPLKNRPTQG